MRKLGSVLIILGILLLLFLSAGHLWQRWQTQRLIQSLESIPFQSLIAEGSVVDLSTVDTVPQGNVWGVLNISKIELETPIVEGVEVKHLRNAVGHLPESGGMDSPNENFVIAGHRSSVFGQFFSRLDELTLDDEFTIRTKSQTYTYQVVEKRVVAPTDIDAILPMKDKKLVTLLTCHPKHSSAQRLLIIAEQVVE